MGGTRSDLRAAEHLPSSKAISPRPTDSHNVVERLKARIADAERLGFQVRCEPLGDEQADWVIVRGKRILFLDLTQTAGEQLSQLNETLSAFQNRETQPIQPISISRQRRQAA